MSSIEYISSIEDRRPLDTIGRNKLNGYIHEISSKIGKLKTGILVIQRIQTKNEKSLLENKSITH